MISVHMHCKDISKHYILPGGNDGLKRRGSLPAAPQSKRGSIGSYSAMVTSSNSGSDLAGAVSSREQSGTRTTELHGCDHMMEHEEAEPVIIQSDTEAIRNGMDENQQVKLFDFSLIYLFVMSIGIKLIYSFRLNKFIE